MKIFTGLFIVAIFVSSLAITSASAKMGGKKGDMMKNMTEHHQMMQDIMGMMKGSTLDTERVQPYPDSGAENQA